MEKWKRWTTRSRRHPRQAEAAPMHAKPEVVKEVLTVATGTGEAPVACRRLRASAAEWWVNRPIDHSVSTSSLLKYIESNNPRYSTSHSRNHYHQPYMQVCLPNRKLLGVELQSSYNFHVVTHSIP